TDKQKNHKLPSGIRMLIRRACNAVLVTEKFLTPAEVNVTFVDDEEIKMLNTQFRNIEKSTDVLSFPLGENGVYDTNPENGAKMLGDIVISIDHAVKQAEAYGHTLQREMAFLTVHSMLHLLGYDHINGGLEQMKMREKEELVLAKLGVVRGEDYTYEE
ncbi:MAG: rRNA maturation RNase YbeY, partial [Acutalibacteraceae bacterium]|nr:rRNA maturation RNase YbeY [Acutalibacteraceae bacterium]